MQSPMYQKTGSRVDCKKFDPTGIDPSAFALNEPEHQGMFRTCRESIRVESSRSSHSLANAFRREAQLLKIMAMVE